MSDPFKLKPGPRGSVEQHSPYYKNALKMRERLNTVSPSFCLAKWLQVTLHLGTGQTHSCHHPVPHHIPLDELKENPSALHNTKFKMEQRKSMLKGKRPKECDYCWNIEDSGDFLSDRHLKSAEMWAREHFDAVVKMPWDQPVNPKYLEVSFSNQCNFKCSYCSPQVSSRWFKEVKDQGAYDLGFLFKHNSIEYLERTQQMPMEEDSNPYIEAFWKWWPDLYKDLSVFRITGGEPLLMSNTYKMLEWINENPRKELSVGINTNLGISENHFKKFLDLAEPICRDKKLKDLTLYTSADTSGSQAEYIRNGMDYNQWLKNIDRVFQRLPNIRVVVMCTFNNLSVSGFRGLINDIHEIRLKYTTDEWRIILDIAYLRYPTWQSVQILTPEYFQQIHGFAQHMDTLRSNTGSNKFLFTDDVELEKMLRLASWAPSAQNEKWVEKARGQFYKFFSEHDRRRGTNFLETFPEMEEFWKLCESHA